MRTHAGVIAVLAAIVGVLVIGGAVVGVAVHVAHSEEHRRQEQQEVFVAGERRAEQIVVGSERAACKRAAANLTQSLNAWFYVVRADFEAATNPEAAPRAAHIRLVEAIGIDHAQSKIAARVEEHDAHRLISTHWRHVAQAAHFSCARAFPLP